MIVFCTNRHFPIPKRKLHYLVSLIFTLFCHSILIIIKTKRLITIPTDKIKTYCFAFYSLKMKKGSLIINQVLFSFSGRLDNKRLLYIVD